MAKSNLTSLNNFIEKFSGHEFWMGADVPKRSYHIAIYLVDGKVRTFVCPASPLRLLRKFQNLNVTIAGLISLWKVYSCFQKKIPLVLPYL